MYTFTISICLFTITNWYLNYFIRQCSIICLDYELRTSIDKVKENGFELTKERSRRYPAKTLTDTDYADELALLANAPVQTETLLHSLERATAGSNAGALGNAKYPFIAIALWSTLALSCGTWEGSIYGSNRKCLTFKLRVNKWLMLIWIVWNRTVCHLTVYKQMNDVYTAILETI